MINEQYVTLPKENGIDSAEIYIKTMTHQQPFGERDVIIMVPGGPGNDHTMYDTPDNSIARAFLKVADVVMFDPRACGKSSKAKIEDCGLQQYVRDIELIRLALNIPPEKTILFGQSYGSIVATSYVIEYPTHVKKLLLIGGIVDASFLKDFKNTIDDIGSDDQKYCAQQLLTGTMDTSLEGVAKFLRIMSPLYMYTAIEGDQAPVEIPYNVDVLNYGWRHVLPNINLINDLPKIQCPTLILWGEDEKFFSRQQVLQLHEGIQGSELKIYTHCGHMLWLDQWDLFVSDTLSYIKQ